MAVSKKGKVTALHSLTDGAEWISGRRFGGGVSRNDMITWVNSKCVSAEQKYELSVKVMFYITYLNFLMIQNTRSSLTN